MADGLSIRLRTLAGSPHLVTAGEVEISTVNLLASVADAVIRTRAAIELTLDLSAVTFIDDVGVAAVNACRRQATTRGLRFRVINPSAAVRAALNARDRRKAVPKTSRRLTPATALNPGMPRPRGRSR
ncbi:STAS domain-containing protein [Catellatospora sp. NPDC049133]|uniref:STAS domain-containing protein n=1 Tax=Catellatospora sp. NPDC049133 TaxID=3155499 RepID=UPI0033F98834